MSASQSTADDAASSSRRFDDFSTEPQLFLVLECDRLAAGGARYSLAGSDTVVIGRGTERGAKRSIATDRRELRLDVPSRAMSATHARLVRAPPDWVIEDLASRNGTFINGERITRTTLRDGDLLELGRTLFILRTGLPVPAGTPADLDTSELEAEKPGLATLLPLDWHRMATFRQIAASEIPMLLLGETGTGKELLARALHEISGRRGRFVAVNCGALSPSLTESQLFGHLKGSFSGATRDSVGFVRAAEGGTLFLDEIGDLAVPAQAALLRMVEEAEVVPIGAAHAVKVDVRIVAATHKPIESDPEQNRFRSDLLARIAGYTHRLTSLGERREDIGLLIASLLREITLDRAKEFTLAPNAARALLLHTWPMNIRELKQFLKTSTLLANDGVIRLGLLPPAIAGRPQEPSPQPAPGLVRGDRLTDDEERLKSELIANLRAHRGNVTAVSRVMAKGPTQIHRWMKRFGVDPNDFR
jgi:pSer/pThr/pTyr-binding forkhead associated (FHA) protein